MKDGRREGGGVEDGIEEEDVEERETGWERRGGGGEGKGRGEGYPAAVLMALGQGWDRGRQKMRVIGQREKRRPLVGL
jgi:hypothetical protein